MQLPCTWKEWSELGQVVALGAGTAFLLAKAFFGYFMINLTITPTVQRVRGRDRGTDDILLTLKFVKGDREAATLSKVVITPFALNGTNGPVAQDPQVEGFVNPSRNRALKLSPGETAEFSYHFEVPSDSTYKFKVELFGGSGFVGKPECYWAVTAVSMPVPETRES